jgi:hypothetical protein
MPQALPAMLGPRGPRAPHTGGPGTSPQPARPCTLVWPRRRRTGPAVARPPHAGSSAGGGARAARSCHLQPAAREPAAAPSFCLARIDDVAGPTRAPLPLPAGGVALLPGFPAGCKYTGGLAGALSSPQCFSPPRPRTVARGGPAWPARAPTGTPAYSSPGRTAPSLGAPTVPPAYTSHGPASPCLTSPGRSAREVQSGAKQSWAHWYQSGAPPAAPPRLRHSARRPGRRAPGAAARAAPAFVWGGLP